MSATRALRLGRWWCCAPIAGVLACLVAGGAGAADSGGLGELVDRSAFRVCADPSYMPFSNDKGEGFENKIAELFAQELGVPLVYTWYPRSTGFVRNTLRAHRCDVIIGVVAADELVQNTNPYYRSSYVMAVRSADRERLASLDSPAMASARIGVVAATPPYDLLIRKGLEHGAEPYPLMVDPRFDNQGRRLVEDLAAGTIDVALAWGPLVGWWAAQQKVPITLTLLESDRRTNLLLDFRISLGIRAGEPLWKHELEAVTRKLQPQITAILAAYGVPLLDHRGRPLDLATAAPPTAAPPTAAKIDVAEPEGYRTENYRAPTPSGLSGAKTIGVEELESLIATARPVLVDVLPRQPRPADRPADAVWIAPQRLGIPGSVWLPNTGFGYLPDATVAYLRDSLASLTGGDSSRPLVFYCDPDCWMSWNAAKRAMTELGYTQVYWFRDGVDGWKQAGRETERVQVYNSAQSGLGE